MAKTNTADTPETGETGDAPLIDLNEGNLKKLIARAKKRGYITYEQLNEALPPDVMPYSACFGRFRDRDMRRWSWNSLSSVAADRPLDMLPVNLAMLSENPKTDFLTKLDAPLAMPIPSS